MSYTNLLEANKVVLKKKIFSIREHYDLQTPKGKKLGEANGNLLQIPVKFNVNDAKGAEVMKIEEKLFMLRTQFTFYDPTGIDLGKITKKLIKLIGEEYWIDKNGVEFMRIYGDFTNHDYKMVVNGVQVASVHRKWISIRDQLVISIIADVDHRLVLGAVVVIEHIEVTEREKAKARALAAYRQVKHELDDKRQKEDEKNRQIMM